METEIKIKLQTVTPELAKKWLESNLKNRHLNVRTVDYYHQQMVRGQWQVTGDPIKFSTIGNLIDGQHRLQAIIKYGKPVELFVANGLEESVFTVIDTGRNRTAGDIVSTMGVKYANTLAAAARNVLMFRNGNYYDGRSKTVGITNTEILDFVNKNKDFEEIVVYVMSIYTQFRLIPSSAFCMLYFILSKKNQEKADIFFNKYATGIDLGLKSPIRVLRERLLRDQQNKTRLTSRDKVALFIHAWNAYLKGKELVSIRLVGNYEFPRPI